VRDTAMRVCLASIHPRMLSGQIEGLLALGRGLRASGHDVRLVSAFPEAALYQDTRWTRATGDAGSLAPKVLRIGRIVRDVCRAARDADIVHLNLPTPAFALLADVVQVVTRRPVVVGYEAQLCSPRALLAGGHLGRAPGFYGPRAVVNNRLVARLAAQRGSRYVVSSAVQRHELLALGLPPERIAVIPALVDAAKLRRWPRAAARRRLGLPPTEPLIAYVGHYHPVKGVELLPAALRRVQRTVPGAHLALAWSGIGEQTPVREAIERAGVRERVIELGPVEVGQLLSAADVLAAPYVLTIGQAAFPAVPLEAMHLGTPLVTSDLPLLRELTDDGEAAQLVRPGDVESLAAGLAALLRDPGRAAVMVAAQRRLTNGRYHPGRVSRRYARLYEAVVRGQADLLQPAFGDRELRAPAVWRPERPARQPAGTGDRRAAA
jgi:glycosyltransferase involved in cell wall biosynthesis